MKFMVTLLIWIGVFKHLPTPKRHELLRKSGYDVMDNTELNRLLEMATKKSKEHEHDLA